MLADHASFFSPIQLISLDTKLNQVADDLSISNVDIQ
jgi:hypothetical protein